MIVVFGWKSLVRAALAHSYEKKLHFKVSQTLYRKNGVDVIFSLSFYFLSRICIKIKQITLSKEKIGGIKMTSYMIKHSKLIPKSQKNQNFVNRFPDMAILKNGVS